MKANPCTDLKYYPLVNGKLCNNMSQQKVSMILRGRVL